MSEIQAFVKAVEHRSRQPERCYAGFHCGGNIPSHAVALPAKGQACLLAGALQRLADHSTLEAENRNETVGKRKVVSLDHEIVPFLQHQGNGSQQMAGERRTSPRRASICHVTICRMEDETEGSVHSLAWKFHSSRTRAGVVDISQAGIAFLSWQAFAIGEPLRLRITNPLFDRSLVAVGEVVRQEQTSNGSWRVMCCFRKSLAYQQLEFFGSHLFSTDVV